MVKNNHHHQSTFVLGWMVSMNAVLEQVNKIRFVVCLFQPSELFMLILNWVVATLRKDINYVKTREEVQHPSRGIQSCYLMNIASS